MTEVPQWRLVGDWFDVCSCTVPCPCTFAQPPTNNHCQGVLAWHIRDGRFGDVRLDGLNVLGVAEFEGNIWVEADVAMAPTRPSSVRCRPSSVARQAAGRRCSRSWSTTPGA